MSLQMTRAGRTKRWGWVLPAALILTTAQDARAAGDQIVEKLEHGEINWTTKTVVATGSGAPNLKLKNVAAVRLNAERAAKVDAYRNVVEALKGVRVTAKETGAGALSKPQIQTQVQGILRGCKTVDTRYYSDGGVDIVIRCSLDGGLATTIAPVKERKKVKTAGDAKYSGLIIDAIGTSAQPSLRPRLLDDQGQPVYESAMVGPTTLRQHGAVAFARSVDEAKANGRIGKTPLVVKAASLGEQPSDIQISAEDAAKIREANQNFLAEARVVIATDGP